ncbi:MAG: hypothetical protein HQL75_11760 [Magnetococcales bacterium]|nr:hypothetical protein [Magnetococcales bacterium]
MTELLEKAFVEAAKLPKKEQTALAQRILAELTADAAWEKRFTEHPEILDMMAKDALQEFDNGETLPIGVSMCSRSHERDAIWRQ